MNLIKLMIFQENYHMTNIQKSLLLLSLLLHFSAAADLRPYYISVEISASKTRFTCDEIVELSVQLKNLDVVSHSVLTPGNQSKGNKMIYFSWYKVDKNNFYTEVYRDKRTIEMDTSVKGYCSSKRLDPSESVSLCFLLNDKKNANRHIYSNYVVPSLPPGKYKIIAWYNPWDEEIAHYFYNRVDWKGNDENPDKNPELLDLSESGTNSAYFDVEIVSTQIHSRETNYTKACPRNCHLCRAIEKGHWNTVERIIRRQSSYRNALSKIGKRMGNWAKKHRNVAYYGPYPDAILSSLPSYTGIEIVFKNKKGYHYFYLSWQLAKIKHVNSFFNRLWQWSFHRCCPLKSSKNDYTMLKAMRKW